MCNQTIPDYVGWYDSLIMLRYDGEVFSHTWLHCLCIRSQ